MAALALLASQARTISPLSLVGRLFSAMTALIDVFADAERHATDAERKFRFTSW
jgi:hypothetical protein